MRLLWLPATGPTPVPSPAPGPQPTPTPAPAPPLMSPPQVIFDDVAAEGWAVGSYAFVDTGIRYSGFLSLVAILLPGLQTLEILSMQGAFASPVILSFFTTPYTMIYPSDSLSILVSTY